MAFYISGGREKGKENFTKEKEKNHQSSQDIEEGAFPFSCKSLHQSKLVVV